MLQGRGGTQVHVKTRVAGIFNASKGKKEILAWAGVMNLRLISFSLLNEVARAIARQDDVMA